MKKSIYLMLAAALTMGNLWAVETIDLREANNLNQKLQQVRNIGELSHQAMLQNILGLSTDNTLQLLSSRTDEAKKTQSRYRLLYRGVPVWGENIIVTEDAQNRSMELHGRAVVGLQNELTAMTAAFDAKTALEMMKNHHQTTLAATDRQERVFENELSEIGRAHV